MAEHTHIEMDETPSFEDRCRQLGKRLRTAHRAGVGLDLSRDEVQLLGLTTVADWYKPSMIVNTHEPYLECTILPCGVSR